MNEPGRARLPDGWGAKIAVAVRFSGMRINGSTGETGDKSHRKSGKMSLYSGLSVERWINFLYKKAGKIHWDMLHF